MKKTIGTVFQSQIASPIGIVRILGSWYDYKVIAGTPAVGALLEVVDFTSRELLVVVTAEKNESDVNYIDNL